MKNLSNISPLEAEGYVKGLASAELEQVMFELDANTEVNVDLLKQKLAEIHSLLVMELPKVKTD
jgi:hypothetical protein